MKILLCSDIHGFTENVKEMLEKEGRCVVLFLGDGEADIMRQGDLQLYAVCGNCDVASINQLERVVELCDSRIFMTHGHKYHVKLTQSPVVNAAHRLAAAVCIYGHTHKQVCSDKGGLLVINPGSLGYNKEYAVLELNEGLKPICTLKCLKNED